MVEEKIEAKIRILKRKWRFRGFRHRWFQIFRSQIEIRKELEKMIFKFAKSNFGSENWKSKSNFRFWGPDFLFFGNQNSFKINILVLMSRFFIFSKQNLKPWTKTKVDNKRQRVSGCLEAKIAQLWFTILRVPIQKKEENKEWLSNKPLLFLPWQLLTC